MLLLVVEEKIRRQSFLSYPCLYVKLFFTYTVYIDFILPSGIVQNCRIIDDYI